MTEICRPILANFARFSTLEFLAFIVYKEEDTSGLRIRTSACLKLIDTKYLHRTLSNLKAISAVPDQNAPLSRRDETRHRKVASAIGFAWMMT